MKVEEGVFINGKAQILEMLQYMTPNERQTLINNIKHKNPQLASEMMDQSFSFEQIEQLSDNHFKKSFQYIQAPIWGIALKGTSAEFQRRVLSIAPREYAEKAFEMLNVSIQNEARDIKRAQKKIIDTILSFSKNNMLNP